MSEAALPKGWTIKRLSELARVTSGKRLPKGRRLSTAQTDHPYIRVTDMFMGGVNSSDIQHVPDDVFPEISRFTVDAGDIFISCAGTLGLVGMVPEALDGANLTENANRIWSIECDRRFLLSVLLSDRIQSVIQNIQTVGAQPKLALERIRDFEIPCPDTLQEQQAIAAALSDADGVVAGLERVIAKKRLIKQGAMQDLLTARRRLPGFSGEWEVKRLGDVARFGKGKGLPKSDVLCAGPFKCIHYGSLFREQPAVISQLDTFTTWFNGAVQSEDGDVLMPTSDVTPSGLAVASCITMPEVILGGDILIIKPDAAVLNGQFLSSVIRNSKTQIMELVSGTTVFHIYAGDMARFTFAAPSVAEQQAIAAVLSDMDTEIQTLEARLTKARAVKEGMMQNLLTGRVRLV